MVFQRPALVAGLTALMLSVPATALAQPATTSPAPTRTALTTVWQQIHQVRGLPEPAWLKTGTSRTATRMAPVSGAYQGALEGVSSVPSSTRAWAVGVECASGCGTSAEVDDTLVLHYDGTSWNASASLNPSATFNELTSVKALSDTNVWAVGDYCAANCGTTTEVDDTLVLHWDGSSWKQFTSKNPSASLNVLTSVTAASSSDVWAAGLKCNSGCTRLLTLTEHWNGSSWSNISSPSPSSTYNVLTGVSSFPTHKAWAAGSNGSKTLVLRWTGTKWASVSSPNPSSASNALAGVSASSASNAWAVGAYGSSVAHTLALHWNGTKWSKVSTPNPSSAVNVLEGVAARTGSDAWTVGMYCKSACGQLTEADSPLIVHWNGSSWSRKAANFSGTGFAALYAVSAHSGTNAWAVGAACSANCGTTSEVDSTLIEHWNGTSWAVS